MFTFLLARLVSALLGLLCHFVLLVAATVAWRAHKLHRTRARRPVQARDAILITGATSGIGLALAKYLFKRGFSVLAGFYDASEPGYGELTRLAAAAAAAAAAAGSQAPRAQLLLIPMNVRCEHSLAAAYATCARQLADRKLRLWALVNNAGLGSLQPFAWLQRGQLRAIVETNLLGTMLATREFLPMLAESSGRLVNVSSGLGLVPGPGYASYGATKQAQLYLTQSLNMELADRYGVRSVAVIPHNYVKSTNICAQNRSRNESAWEEMKPEERRLYQEHYQQQCRLTRALDDATRRHVELAAAAAAAATSGRSPQPPVAGWLLSPAASLLRAALMLFQRLAGQNETLTLEQSGTLECFEDALRLEDPPEHIFAGDNIYNLLVGSILLCLPASCMRLLARSISNSLYK